MQLRARAVYRSLQRPRMPVQHHPTRPLKNRTRPYAQFFPSNPQIVENTGLLRPGFGGTGFAFFRGSPGPPAIQKGRSAIPLSMKRS